MLSYSATLYRPIYLSQGVQATMTTNGVANQITVLDKTSGVSLSGPIELETTRPAATMMAQDLIALGFSIGDGSIDGSTLAMNGKNWHIISTRPMPSPNGYNDGEVYALLEEIDG